MYIYVYIYIYIHIETKSNTIFDVNQFVLEYHVQPGMMLPAAKANMKHFKSQNKMMRAMIENSMSLHQDSS